MSGEAFISGGLKDEKVPMEARSHGDEGVSAPFQAPSPSALGLTQEGRQRRLVAGTPRHILPKKEGGPGSSFPATRRGGHYPPKSSYVSRAWQERRMLWVQPDVGPPTPTPQSPSKPALLKPLAARL